MFAHWRSSYHEIHKNTHNLLSAKTIDATERQIKNFKLQGVVYDKSRDRAAQITNYPKYIKPCGNFQEMFNV